MINPGRIVAVNAATFTVDVATENGRFFQNVPITSWASSGGSYGSYFVPPIGERCLVYWDTSYTYVISFIPESYKTEEGSLGYGKFRFPVNPGEIWLHHASGSQFALLDGDKASLSANQATWLFMDGASNKVTMHLKEYEVVARGADLAWTDKDDNCSVTETVYPEPAENSPRQSYVSVKGKTGSGALFTEDAIDTDTGNKYHREIKPGHTTVKVNGPMGQTTAYISGADVGITTQNAKAKVSEKTTLTLGEVEIKADTITINTGGTSVQIDSGGISINGTQVTFNCGSQTVINSSPSINGMEISVTPKVNIAFTQVNTTLSIMQSIFNSHTHVATAPSAPTLTPMPIIETTNNAQVPD